MFGTKIYFKVLAIANGDTTETYKFMYTVKENKHCTSSGTMAYQGNVTLVDFEDINNATGKIQPYADYTATDSTIVFIDSTYELIVNLNTDGGDYTYYSTVWIDWNQDTMFEASERYEVGSAQNVSDMPTDLSPFSIQVPSNAVLGKTKMRVVCNYNSYQTDPCANGYDGEVEDYSLIVEVFSDLSIQNSDLQFNIYPNPTQNSITIDFANEVSQSFILTNGLGQLIKRIKIENKNSIQVDMSSLSDGIYFLQVLNDEKSIVTRIIKQ